MSRKSVIPGLELPTALNDSRSLDGTPDRIQLTDRDRDQVDLSASEPLAVSLAEPIYAAAAFTPRGLGKGGGGAGGGYGGGGSGGGGGGGSHEETAGNNLSFPVIFPQGVTPLALRGDMNELTLTIPYTTITEPVPPGYVWFAQKVDGNEWQAGNRVASAPIVIDAVDMGDALESARLRIGNFIRVELALFDNLNEPMRAYEMAKIGGQGKTEVQGTRLEQDRWMDGGVSLTGSQLDTLLGSTTYLSDRATVYTPAGVMGLTIQKFAVDPVAGLAWDGSMWVGNGIDQEDLAENTKLGAELTVSGKVISGVSGSPWKFTEAGSYRITFDLKEGSSVSLGPDTEFINVAGPRAEAIVPDGEMSYGVGADTHNGLIYMDVQVPSQVAGGDELASQFLSLAAATQSSF